MKQSCIGIPRILLPQKDFDKWAVIACDQFTSNRDYWARVAKKVGETPSTLRFILPEAYLGEDDEARIQEIHQNMYEAMEAEWVEKLSRGMILTERETSTGTRRGIVTTIDLEAYTLGKGESSPIRSSEEVVKERLPARVAVRRGALLEFPHAMVFYQDVKGKIMQKLDDEDLEKLYDFDLMEGGGRVVGYFIPDYCAAEIANMMQTRKEPCLAIADGNHSVAAAKAYWEELKPTLTETEKEYHPARYTLVELVNLYDEAIVFHPIHRVVFGVEKEAFCDFYMKSVKCRREGDLLVPSFANAADGVQKTDMLIEEFIKANGGKVDYIHGKKSLQEIARRENGVGIVMGIIDKDDFFAQLKGGGNFPKKTFSVGKAKEKRYYLEGREISYD